MKLKFRRLSIQQKITRAILITSSVVILLISLTYLIYEYVNFRKITMQRISILGEVISTNTMAALAFDSPTDAYEVLKAVQADQNIIAAVIYDENGKIFAKYPNVGDDNRIPKFSGNVGYTFSRSYVEGYEPIFLGAKKIGTLYLKYDLKVFRNQLLYFSYAALLIFFISMILAYLLSSKLQIKISLPIITLASFARRISIEKDYSARAIKQSDDEIGLLTDSFNQMLSQIEQQSADLKQNEKRFKAIADNIAQLAWMTDDEGKIIWYNKRWYDYTGLSPEVLNQKTPYELHLHPAHLERVLQKFSEAKRTGEEWEDTFPLKGKNGKYRWFLSRAVPINDESGKILHYFGTNTDISDIREFEEALKKSEEFSRALVESSPDCVIVLDLNMNILSINFQGQNMLDITHINSFIDRRFTELWPEKYHEVINDSFQTALNGTIGHTLLHAPTLKGKMKWWDLLISPVVDDHDKPEGFISVARDITVLKELEQQKDDFIGIASHELKTPVTVIKAYSELLNEHFAESDDVKSKEMLGKMNNQLIRLSNLITDLLDVTKIEQGNLLLNKESFEINQLVQDVCDEMQKMSKKHKLGINLSDEAIVYADRERIGQVLINLITNAIKYSPYSADILVSIIKNHNEAIISVQDFGIGLQESDQKKIFNRFYRVSSNKTHETYPGLGLGLYISANIITRHEGKIWVEGSSGKGSTFYFSLPLYEEKMNHPNQTL